MREREREQHSQAKITAKLKDENNNKKAIKLQSFIRGYLVRKKVLRYVTLAIYYQSFCDKLQDVLCNNVKKEIFALLKSKFKKINKKKTDIKKKKLTQQIVIQRITKLSTLINKKTQKHK